MSNDPKDIANDPRYAVGIDHGSPRGSQGIFLFEYPAAQVNTILSDPREARGWHNEYRKLPHNFGTNGLKLLRTAIGASVQRAHVADYIITTALVFYPMQFWMCFDIPFEDESNEGRYARAWARVPEDQELAIEQIHKDIARRKARIKAKERRARRRRRITKRGY